MEKDYENKINYETTKANFDCVNDYNINVND